MEDLAYQDDIEYGAMRHGSTEAFFKNAKHPIFMRMGHEMEEEDMVGSLSEVNSSNFYKRARICKVLIVCFCKGPSPCTPQPRRGED